MPLFNPPPSTPAIGCELVGTVNYGTTDGFEEELLFSDSQVSYDTNTMFSEVANPYRITIKTAGKYQIGCNFSYDKSAASFDIKARFKKNGAAAVGQFEKRSAGSNTVYNSVVLMAEESCVVNDYFTLAVYQNSGGTLNIVANGTAPFRWWVRKVG